MGVVIALAVVRRDFFDNRGRPLAEHGTMCTPQLSKMLRLHHIEGLWSDLGQNAKNGELHDLKGEHLDPVLSTDLATLRAACQDVTEAINWLQNHTYLRFHLAALMDHMGWVYSHSLNVAVLTAIMALRLGLEQSQRIELAAGALLHDIGNIFVPPGILNKPGSLSPDERAAVNQHTSLGENMLTRTGIPYRIACIVGQHHERWGGQGYPRHLKGPNIDLGAQIVGVADVFDALTSVRPHRGAAAFSEAQRYLLQRKNIDFHGTIISLLFRQRL